MANEIFGRKPVNDTKKAITADMCTIMWGDDPNGLLGGTNMSLQYQQQIVRRRTFGQIDGAPIAIIYPTQPQGSFSVSRLAAEGVQNIFELDGGKGWNVCNGTTTIRVNFKGATAYTGCNVNGGEYVLHGCLVEGVGIQAEAEGLTVVSNVNVQFLTMDYNE